MAVLESKFNAECILTLLAQAAFNSLTDLSCSSMKEKDMSRVNKERKEELMMFLGP